MNTLLRRAATALMLMLAALAVAQVMTPTRKIATVIGAVNLESMVPKQFGDWRVDTNAFAGVVNPEAAALLDRLYSQTLSRTYINAKGQRIMLSIAYGEDQREKTTAMHYPEVCYPAQGFELHSNRVGSIGLPQGTIPVRRLEAVLGRERYEPVTYWTMIADQATLGGVRKKLIEMKYGLRGEIADGLLFRVSSIDRDSAEAFALQERFIADLLASVPVRDRKRLAGLA